MSKLKSMVIACEPSAAEEGAWTGAVTRVKLN